MEAPMLDQPEWAYHVARGEQCRRMALMALDDAIRELHEALADQHAQRARSAFLFESHLREPVEA
jgi:hypothetical protein